MLPLSTLFVFVFVFVFVFPSFKIHGDWESVGKDICTNIPGSGPYYTKCISLKGKISPYSLVPPKPCAPAVYCTQPVSPIFQLLFVPCTILWQKCMCEMVMCKVCPQFDRLTAEKSCRSFFFLFNPELDLFQQHLVWMFLSYFRYWLLSFLQFCSQLQPLRPMCFFTLGLPGKPGWITVFREKFHNKKRRKKKKKLYFHIDLQFALSAFWHFYAADKSSNYMPHLLIGWEGGSKTETIPNFTQHGHGYPWNLHAGF